MDESRGYRGGYWDRRLSRRRALRGGAVGVAGVAAFYAACGGSTNNNAVNKAATSGAAPAPARTGGAGSPAAAAAQQPGGTPTVNPNNKPKVGGSVTFGYSLNPSSLDPQLGNSGGDAYYWKAMFDTLVGYDQNYNLVPELSLAQAWETPDQQSIVFHLRNNVTLHDGTTLDSALVQWNIQRVLDPTLKSTAAALLAAIDHVETPDAQTARFVLKSPDSALLGLLGDRGGTIISRQAAGKYGDQFGANPVGAGPFQFEQWVPNSLVKIKAFPNYWRKDALGGRLPYLDELTIRIVPDPTAGLAAVQSGEFLLSSLAAKDVQSVQGNNAFNLLQFPGGGVASLFAFNLDHPDVKDPRVRKAICYAVDPSAANKLVHFGINVVADAGMWPAGLWVYQPVPGRPTFDPTKAKQLLSAAGVTNLTVNMPTWTDDPTQVQQATLYQSQLKQVGITANIQQNTVGVATANFYTNGQGDVYSTGWSRYPEPDYNAELLYTSTGFYNPMKHEITPQLTQLVAQGREEYDQNKRKQIYAQINDVVINQVTYYVPLIYATGLAVTSKKLAGTDTLFGGDGKWQYTYLSMA